jgi:hypothetical protein
LTLAIRITARLSVPQLRASEARRRAHCPVRRPLHMMPNRDAQYEYGAIVGGEFSTKDDDLHGFRLVELARLELATSWVRSRRSPN